MGELGSQGYRHKGQTGRRRKEGWQRQEVRERKEGEVGNVEKKEQENTWERWRQRKREEASRQREAGDRDGERVKIAPH